MKKLMVLAIIVWASCVQIKAQDLQNRTLVQVALDFNRRGYIELKFIPNVKSQTPDNANVFFGAGYRGKSWWLEGLANKQWNPAGGYWSADARFLKKFGEKGKTVLYAEAQPFLSQKAFGWSMLVDTEIWKKISVGAGTENLVKLGQNVNSLELPRIGRRLGRFAGFDVSATVALRFDPLCTTKPREIRLYLVLNRRFALADRK